MKHITFHDAPIYSVAILIKEAALIKNKLEEHYIKPLEDRGLGRNRVIGFSLAYEGGKASAKLKSEYLSNLLKALDSLQCEHLYVCDADYFKYLTKERKAEAHYGYTLPCKIKGYEHLKITLGTNYQSLFYNPDNQSKLDLSLDKLVMRILGVNVNIGEGIIKNGSYPKEIKDIAAALNDLHQHPAITCDAETFSLKHHKARIGTIGFAWNKHSGIAFNCAYIAVPDSVRLLQVNGKYGFCSDNALFYKEVKKLLKEFFINYQGKIIYHNANFDIKILIYELFMDTHLDNAGMLKGIEVLTKNIDDTKIITYLATNSCAGNNLKLKDQAHEFAGNYAQADINDITLIPNHELLEYNLIDCLSTWFVYEKHHPTMVEDNQLDVYEKVFKLSLIDILQMELTGMPLDMPEVYNVQKELTLLEMNASRQLTNSPVIRDFVSQLRKEEYIAQNLLWKRKKEPLEYFNYINFKPNSVPQLQKLLYEEIGFDVIDLTDKKMPATGSKTLKKLIHKTNDPDIISMLENLITLSDVKKILNTFIKAFIDNSIEKDGHYYLHGNFNLGGTVSGRLSSSGPNLQNIPSGSKYAKHIKRCFKAPLGWVFCGADFNSLEDYISALTTKDPNKLKVYIEKYDGHCLRAFGYFRKDMPDIVDTVLSINSIKHKYPELRQKSKTPTFALTYGGTYHAICDQTGLPEDEAKAIEENYHKMYKVSDDWVQSKLIEASSTGYVTVAFGLRVRTPILKQCILSMSSTPYEAQAEGRTAGNALGQSYGLLNNYACSKFMSRVRASQFASDIKPVAMIHDAIYLMIRDDINVVKYTNDNLIDCMAWQDLPELRHDIVKIGAELDLFYPTWNDAITLPNHASKEEIREICNKQYKE